MVPALRASAPAAAQFKKLADGKARTLAPWYGERLGILVCDRGTALTFWAMERRQVRWAHLRRTFVSFSERTGRAGESGTELLDYVGILFSYRDEMKRGKLSRAELRAHMKPPRRAVQ